MTDQNIPPPAICPVGFTQGELTTLEIFFRISRRRPPGWLIALNQADAKVLLLNAAGMNVAEYCRNLGNLAERGQQIVIVGPSDFGTNHRFIERPIKLNAMLNLINDVHDDALPDTVAAPLDAADWAVLSETVPAPLAPITVLPPIAPPPALITNVLPARAPARSVAPAKPVFPVVTAATTAPARSTSRRMLVVDDNDIALNFMSTLLKRNNFEYQLAKSGEEALTIVAASRFDLVFLDVTMEGMDGYQTCRSIKKGKYPSGRAPIIIMLTSRAGTFDKIKGTMAGCDAYLTKPLNVKQLAVLLAKFDLSPVRQNA
jgi:two-component system, cell cycle response regulator